MGRKIVVEIECDRCTRVEHKAVTPETEKNKEEYVLQGIFKGKATEYKDLCTACEEIVTMRWAEIAKSLKKASPQRDRTGKIAVKEVPAKK